MTTLDQDKTYKAYDKKQQIESIKQLSLQCEDAWEHASRLNFPSQYNKIKNIIVVGMGASNYNADILQSLFQESLPAPFTLVSDYQLPAFADFSTLVVLSSYSGNTEEVLTVGQKALEAGCLLTGVSGGASLGSFLTDQHVPHYVFDGKYNSCNVPRIGFGYSVMGLLGLFNSLGLLSIDPREVSRTIAFMKEQNQYYDPTVVESDNWAKAFARSLKGYMPVIVGAEHLIGNSRVFRNQLCENSKQFAVQKVLPDLNHYLMEGLAHPDNVDKLMFVFFDTALYSSKIAQRVKITQAVLEKQHIHYTSIPLKTDTKLMNVFELMQKGSFAAYYLAILNQVDPSPNPWVDYFKAQLK